jgi:hypothetical protein
MRACRRGAGIGLYKEIGMQLSLCHEYHVCPQGVDSVPSSIRYLACHEPATPIIILSTVGLGLLHDRGCARLSRGVPQW